MYKHVKLESAKSGQIILLRLFVPGIPNKLANIWISVIKARFSCSKVDYECHQVPKLIIFLIISTYAWGFKSNPIDLYIYWLGAFKIKAKLIWNTILYIISLKLNKSKTILLIRIL